MDLSWISTWRPKFHWALETLCLWFVPSSVRRCFYLIQAEWLSCSLAICGVWGILRFLSDLLSRLGFVTMIKGIHLHLVLMTAACYSLFLVFSCFFYIFRAGSPSRCPNHCIEWTFRFFSMLLCHLLFIFLIFFLFFLHLCILVLCLSLRSSLFFFALHLLTCTFDHISSYQDISNLLSRISSPCSFVLFVVP